MIQISCPNCQRKKEVENDVIISVCSCGEIIEVKNGRNN